MDSVFRGTKVTGALQSATTEGGVAVIGTRLVGWTLLGVDFFFVATCAER
jgi:hypothetical protein